MKASWIAALVLATSACTIGPFDMTEMRGPNDVQSFVGYTFDPSMRVEVLALDQATNVWVPIATTTSSSSVTIAANSWYDNPALYRWAVTAQLTNPCFFNPQCVTPNGDYAQSTVRLKVRQADGFELIVFHDDYFTCMNEEMANGGDFRNSAVTCRAWSYPELRLRVVGEWWRLPGTTASPPAIGVLPGALDVAASNGSTIVVSRSTNHNAIGAWTALGGAPGAGVATDVAPAIAKTPDRTQLRLFARSGNGRLVTTSSTGTWGSLALVPNVSNLSTGRISAALGDGSSTHVAHRGPPGMVSYWRFQGADLATATSHVDVFGGNEAVVGSRGPDQSLLVVRGASSVQVYSFSSWDGWTPRLVGTLSTGAIEDLSEVVYYGSQYHFVYARPLGNGYSELVHATADVSVRTRQIATFVTSSTPAGVALAVSYSRGLDAMGSLALVHAHLIAAWRDTNPGIQTARWDRAQASSPWRREPTIGSTIALTGRPVLDGAPMSAPLNQARPPGFGNDVFVAARGADQWPRFANLTRGMMRRHIERRIELFDYAPSALCSMSSGVPNNSGQNATWLEDLARNDRPIISELGALDWALPSWFTDEVYLAAGKQACLRGDRQPDTEATGRPCQKEKMPVVVKTIGPLFVCPDGPYINHDSSITGSWEEIGHTLSGVMGFNDNAVGPTAADADITDISLSALQAGYALFGQNLMGCGDQPRCPGFTRLYDTTSRQHSFIYAMYAYMFSGNMMRTWIQQDLNRAPCNDLLARKYQWIRNHIYQGVEFGTNGEPLAISTTIPLCN